MTMIFKAMNTCNFLQFTFLRSALDEQNSVDFKGRFTEWNDLYMPKVCKGLEIERNSIKYASKPTLKGTQGLPQPGIGSNPLKPLKPIGPIGAGISAQFSAGSTSASIGAGAGINKPNQQGSTGTGLGIGAQLTVGGHQGSIQLGGGISKPQNSGPFNQSTSSSSSSSSSSQSSGSYETGYGGSENHGNTYKPGSGIHAGGSLGVSGQHVSGGLQGGLSIGQRPQPGSSGQNAGNQQTSGSGIHAGGSLGVSGQHGSGALQGGISLGHHPQTGGNNQYPAQENQNQGYPSSSGSGIHAGGSLGVSGSHGSGALQGGLTLGQNQQQGGNNQYPGQENQNQGYPSSSGSGIHAGGSLGVSGPHGYGALQGGLTSGQSQQQGGNNQYPGQGYPQTLGPIIQAGGSLGASGQHGSGALQGSLALGHNPQPGGNNQYPGQNQGNPSSSGSGIHAGGTLGVSGQHGSGALQGGLSLGQNPQQGGNSQYPGQGNNNQGYPQTSGSGIHSSGTLGISNQHGSAEIQGGVSFGQNNRPGGGAGSAASGQTPSNQGQGQYHPDPSGNYVHVTGPNGPVAPPYEHSNGSSGTTVLNRSLKIHSN